MTSGLNKDPNIEWLQGVWPKIIPVAMEMPILYVNFSSLNYPNLNDESLDLMVDFIKMPNFWCLSMEFYGAWQEVTMCHGTPYIRTKLCKFFYQINGIISLEMSILQIWVTWASKITLKNLQLCSLKIKGNQ